MSTAGNRHAKGTETIGHPDAKEFERRFQNNKYGLTPLDRELHLTTPQAFEELFLLAREEGGQPRGSLFRKAMDEVARVGIQGKTALDYCCGRGALGVYLAQKGAKVFGFDISDEAVKIAQFKAQVNSADAVFARMDAEELRFADASFDLIVGFEALHHVMLYPGVVRELGRVLKRDGTAVFAENWGGDNPVFGLGRMFGGMRRNKSRERGEIILHNAVLRRGFDNRQWRVEVHPQSLLYMVKKFTGNSALLRAVRYADKALLSMLPFLRNAAGEAVIVLRKR